MSLAALPIMDVRSQLSVTPAGSRTTRSGRITSITLHYNGPPVAAAGNPAAELRHIIMVDTGDHQRRLGADSLQYHYCVLSDGQLIQTRDRDLIAWHCGNAEGNAHSLAIHIPIGGLQDATDAQWAAFTALCDALIAEYAMPGRGAVVPHSRWKKDTICPGPQLTRRLAAWTADDRPGAGLYRIRPDIACANVREGPGRSFPVALQGKAIMWPGDVLDADGITRGEAIGGDATWYHRRDELGFVHASLVVPL